MRILTPTLLSALLVLASVSAQPQSGGGQTADLRFSVSADGDLTRAGTAAGEIGVRATSLGWRSATVITPATRLTFGVNWERFDFDRSGVMAVPGILQETSLVLGASHRLNQAWLLTGTLRPGLYGATAGGGSDVFNTPLLLLATWTRSPELAWSFGLRADWFSDREALPFVGVNWKFSPGWELNLGLPRAGVSYTVSPALRLSLGVTLQGGNYHVAQDPRPAAGVTGPALGDTKLDYHEIRAGLAANWRLSPAFTLNLEAGVITDQKFDYFERGLRLDGGGIGFATLGISGRF